MNGLDRFIWLPMIAVNCLNAWISYNRAEQRIGGNAEMMARFEGFLKGFVIFSSAPFIVLGLASILSGQGVFEVGFGTWSNPYTALLDATLMAGWLALAVSVFYLDGAEMMQVMTRPQLFDAAPPIWLHKVFAGLALIGFPILIIAIRSGLFPIPQM
jgi:hypothetical protein